MNGGRIIVSKWHYNVHFQTNTLRKGINPLSRLAMNYIVTQLSIYKDGFGIHYPTKVDMTLNKESNHKIEEYVYTGFKVIC